MRGASASTAAGATTPHRTLRRAWSRNSRSVFLLRMATSSEPYPPRRRARPPLTDARHRDVVGGADHVEPADAPPGGDEPRAELGVLARHDLGGIAAHRAQGIEAEHDVAGEVGHLPHTAHLPLHVGDPVEHVAVRLHLDPVPAHCRQAGGVVERGDRRIREPLLDDAVAVDELHVSQVRVQVGEVLGTEVAGQGGARGDVCRHLDDVNSPARAIATLSSVDCESTYTVGRVDGRERGEAPIEPCGLIATDDHGRDAWAHRPEPTVGRPAPARSNRLHPHRAVAARAGSGRCSWWRSSGLGRRTGRRCCRCASR